MSEERAGYGGRGVWIRATWTEFRYPDQKLTQDYDVGLFPLEFVNVKELRIEPLPGEPAAPHVEVRPGQAQVFVDGHYAGTVIRLEQRDAEPVFEVLKCGHGLNWHQFPSFEAAVAALVAVAQPDPAEPPMRYLGMELT